MNIPYVTLKEIEGVTFVQVFNNYVAVAYFEMNESGSNDFFAYMKENGHTKYMISSAMDWPEDYGITFEEINAFLNNNYLNIDDIARQAVEGEDVSNTEFA